MRFKLFVVRKTKIYKIQAIFRIILLEASEQEYTGREKCATEF